MNMRGAAALISLVAGLGASATFAQSNEAFVEKRYTGDAEPALHLRVYRPEDWTAEDRRPAIVFFFGGGWRNGSPRQFHHHCLRLRDEGFVAMAAEYRVQSKHDSTPLDSFEDAKRAIRWVRAHADELGVDPARIASGGGSAGGHLAAAAAVCESAARGDVRDTPDAVVAFNPALDLTRPKLESMWGQAVYAKLPAISPLQHLAEPHPPMIIFHGEADDVVPYESVEAYVRKAERLGIEPAPILVGYEGAGHGFFNHGRGDGSAYRDTVKRMVGFFRDLGWIE